MFGGPNDIDVDNCGNVYATDAHNSRVLKFRSDGILIAKWDNIGNNDGQFLYPVGISSDKNGDIYVVDGGNNRIQKNKNTGKFLNAIYYLLGIWYKSINNRLHYVVFIPNQSGLVSIANIVEA